MDAKSIDSDFCVIGAGPSGLTVAYELLKAGATVTLVERNDRVGGLSMSHNYDGHIFDVGPKRFHTEDPVVTDFIDEIMRNDLLRIKRSTEVHFFNRYFTWPLAFADLFKMPPGVSAKAVIDIFRKPELTDPASFPQYICSKYGQTLYETFFAPYTAKFLRWDPSDIHSDWASTGINRTVIDSRVKTNNVISMVRGTLLPKKIETEFLYPNTGGFGGFYEKLLALCRQFSNFNLLLGDTVVSLNQSGQTLEMSTTKGAAIVCRDLIWAGNLNSLSALIGTEVRVPYLNTVFFNIICRAEGVRHKGVQWIYVSNGDSLISRITSMKEFGAYTCPETHYNFICEVTDSQRSPRYFNQPADIRNAVLQELVNMNFIKSTSFVDAVHINPVVDTYPIYYRNYLRDFGAAANGARKYSRQIRLLGRSGAYWYNNSDHSIRAAIEMAHRLTNKSDREFDYRSYFGGTHSRAARPAGV